MAIRVNAANPQELLDAIYAGIDDGSIETWAYDDDEDFFHNTASGQWKGQAWLRPSVVEGALALNIIPPTAVLTEEAYAVYHGRFIEMLLSHFDQQFTSAITTALLTPEEMV